MSDKRNPFDDYHIASVSYDDKGRPLAEAPFTPKSDTKRYAVIVPPDKVIPVLFVPGIMGSNLKLKTLPDGFQSKKFVKKVSPKLRLGPPVEVQKESWGDLAWRPDEALFMAQRYRSLEAFERRLLLDPNNTEVDDRADIESAIENFSFDSPGDGREAKALREERKRAFAREMKRRGWGTVMVSSYGPLLGFLEKNMNRMYWRGELNDFWRDVMIGRTRHVLPTERSPMHQERIDWGVTKGDKPLTPDDVKKASRYWYPVHAVGYNWIQSNIDSGRHLAGKIDEFTAHYRKLGYQCEKVILVTHSMGGLVARAAVHPEIGGAEDKVLGVIHGVMPTHGAAAAYRRCHAGFEGGNYYSKSGIASKILGANGPEVAAVFSNSPGALQLLPSKLYGMGWLEVRDGAGQVLEKLPKADPYQEIYAERDAWWRLMHPEWVDPRKNLLDIEINNAWRSYVDNLKLAARYHSKVADTCHANTHIHCGADNDKHRAFGAIRWRPNTQGKLLVTPRPDSPSLETKSGEVKMKDIWMRNGRSYNKASFEIDGQDEAGDGTVPRRSGAALAHKATLAAEHTGYDHQDSYTDRRTQELVAYGIARMVSENMT